MSEQSPLLRRLQGRARYYDAGPDYVDRYTAVYPFPIESGSGVWYGDRSMSTDPYHPQGIGIYHETSGVPLDRRNSADGSVPRMGSTTGGIGRRVSFDSLPEQVQRCILADLADFAEESVR